MSDGKLFCKSCKYIWFKRVDEPKQCPNCQSRFWKTGNTGKRYNFHEIEIGQTKAYKMYWDTVLDVPDEEANLNMYSALRSYERRHPETRFSTEHKGYKMYVYRRA